MSNHHLLGSRCPACPQSWNWGKFHDVFGTACDSDDRQDNPTLRLLVDYGLLYNNCVCPKDHTHGNCLLRLDYNLGIFRCRKKGHPDKGRVGTIHNRLEPNFVNEHKVSRNKNVQLLFTVWQWGYYDLIKWYASSVVLFLFIITIEGYFCIKNHCVCFLP